MTSGFDNTRQPRQGQQTVEIPTPLGSRAEWSPTVGEETLNLISHLSQLAGPERESLSLEARQTLAQCAPPHGPDRSRTGLVVGNIQSGKTMSFTAVAALARDNAYRIVIVITGISDLLFGQSTDRLERDLRLQTRPDRQWQHFKNPKPHAATKTAMEGLLDEWADASAPRLEKRTILITVMKNHRHLKSLVRLLEQLDLSGVPALVIDDEADQAGLNTRVNQGDQSTTYQCLLNLRAALPHHSYLQYTATPQAPLLINLIDRLSPQFVKVLTPGGNYTGGREFFMERPELTRVIPQSEIPTAQVPLHGPPESLHAAMRVFFLGVAAGYIRDEGRGNRSMLVHPSEKVRRHAEYYHWVELTRQTWQQTLARVEGDPDRQELLDEFRDAHADLQSTVPDLPSLDQLVALLPRVLRRTRVLQVNAAFGSTPEISWRDEYGFILVGGQAMDRGFTVEGLTVTYMPRSAGVGNADTIQQRARFLGYKETYLGYCRVFLEEDVRTAYRRYVEHEEDVRSQLMTLESEGKSLDEWRRAFFLDLAFRPTRHSVLDLDYVRGRYANAWFDPKAPHDSPVATDHNRTLVQTFLAGLRLVPDDGHVDRTAFQRHQVAHNVPLRDAYARLLAPLQLTRSKDFHQYLGLQLQVSRFLEDHTDEKCTVYFMSGGAERERQLTDADEINQLFQGANPGARKVYPGDREIRAYQGLTIQIHHLRLVRQGAATLRAVPAVAVWVPEVMARGWLVQGPAGHGAALRARP